MQFGKRTHKPNSVYAVIPLGAALPRTLISDLPGGFGHCLTPHRRRPVAGGPAGAAFRRRAGTGHEPCSLARTSLPIWSCSVWGLPCHSHYWLRGALLPHLFTLTTTAWGSPLEQVRECPMDAIPIGCPTQWWRYVLCGTSRPRALTPASRTLSGTLPCGVRTFLSRQPLLAQGFPAATARSSCQ